LFKILCYSSGNSLSSNTIFSIHYSYYSYIVGLSLGLALIVIYLSINGGLGLMVPGSTGSGPWTEESINHDP